METKVATIVEDILVKGSFSFLTSGPFDSLAGPDIAIVTEVPGTSEVSTPTTRRTASQKEMCLNTFRAWEADENIRPKENSWKKENPKGGEFLIEKCAAVRYRRVQHI